MPDQSQFDKLLAAFSKKSWPAIIRIWVDAGRMTEEEGALRLRLVYDAAGKFATLADLTMHDHLDKAIKHAEAADIPLEDFKATIADRMLPTFGGRDPTVLRQIVRDDLQLEFTHTSQKMEEQEGYLQFVAVLDSRTTEICESLDGTLLRADDPFWDENSPPLHSNCRSRLVGYGAREAGQIGITSRPERGQYTPPEEGWGDREFQYDNVLATKDHFLESIARAKMRNPLW